MNKIKIAVAIGHTLSGADFGAKGYLTESICTREIGEKVRAYLEAKGYEVVFCRIDLANSVGESLAYRVDLANYKNVDLYVEVHLNAGGGKGTEVWIYKNGGTAEEYARNVVNSIAELGYVNRGVKTSQSLYVLKNTKAPALLVESCFVDSKEDADRYNPDAIAKAIVKGLTGTEVKEITPVVPNPTPMQENAKSSYNFRSLQGFIGVSQDNIPGPITLSKCPLLKNGAMGNIVKWLQERLKFLGFNCGATDGIFGEKTRVAVMAFQTSRGLSADGIVGQNTWRKLLGL
jgi:N-acetylmuramoyl-L-alanine amidase